MSKILLADDDVALAKALTTFWKESSFWWMSRILGDFIRSYTYDLIILDWDMPGMSGLEICTQFRQSGATTPILLLTGKSSAEDKEAGLDAGADDYLTKPFHNKELKARIRALLRRPADRYADLLRVDNLRLDPSKRKLTIDDCEVRLQPLEFALLEFLMRHPGVVFSLDDLHARVWGSGDAVTSDAIYAAIKRLRKKLHKDGQSSIIDTVHRQGYRLVAQG